LEISLHPSQLPGTYIPLQSLILGVGSIPFGFAREGSLQAALASSSSKSSVKSFHHQRMLMYNMLVGLVNMCPVYLLSWERMRTATKKV